jgi:hypothetical protein
MAARIIGDTSSAKPTAPRCSSRLTRREQRSAHRRENNDDVPLDRASEHADVGREHVVGVSLEAVDDRRRDAAGDLLSVGERRRLGLDLLRELEEGAAELCDQRVVRLDGEVPEVAQRLVGALHRYLGDGCLVVVHFAVADRRDDPRHLGKGAEPGSAFGMELLVYEWQRQVGPVAHLLGRESVVEDLDSERADYLAVLYRCHEEADAVFQKRAAVLDERLEFAPPGEDRRHLDEDEEVVARPAVRLGFPPDGLRPSGERHRAAASSTTPPSETRAAIDQQEPAQRATRWSRPTLAGPQSASQRSEIGADGASHRKWAALARLQLEHARRAPEQERLSRSLRRDGAARSPADAAARRRPCRQDLGSEEGLHQLVVEAVA